jgi:lipoprotein-anchoring transpeptidase ErfK/SrfK
MPAWLGEVVQQYGMDSARRFVAIDLKTQTMFVWDPAAETPLRELPVSTGDESRGYRTPPWYGLIGKYEGTFQSFGVYADEGWYLFEDHGKILIHSAPYKLVGGQKVYEDMEALGAYPASHGCIRLVPEDAAWFTQWNPQGVPLVILPQDR